MRFRPQAPFSLLVALVLAAVGCGSNPAEVAAGGEPAAVVPPPLDDTPPLSIWLSAERVPPGPVELVAVVVNRTDEEASYGIAGEVDRWDGEEWVSHRVLAMCMDHWHCTSELRPVGAGLEIQDIGLSAALGRPGPPERFTTDGLEVGWYRLTQTVHGGTVVSGTFEVADGVSPPAPLVSVNAPAISVSPVVVPPAGGEVSLYPLIPAPSGSQSADDIHRAVEGLAEVAAVEAWDGGRWAQVTEVALGGRGPEQPDRQRTADLPALEPGAYRLVRTGPAGDHAGHFWVAALDAAPAPAGSTTIPEPEPEPEPAAVSTSSAPTTSASTTSSVPSGDTRGAWPGSLADLDLRLEVDDATLAPGEETDGYLVVENHTAAPIVDPGCRLSNVEVGVVAADDPEGPVHGRVMTDCGGSFTMPTGDAERLLMASFTASDATGAPLEPGEYLAVVRHGHGIEQLSAPLVVSTG